MNSSVLPDLAPREAAPTGAATAVAADPDGLLALARALEEAHDEVSAMAAEVVAALDSVEQVDDATAELYDTCRWLRDEADDVRRRAQRARAAGVPVGRGDLLGLHSDAAQPVGLAPGACPTVAVPVTPRGTDLGRRRGDRPEDALLEEPLHAGAPLHCRGTPAPRPKVGLRFPPMALGEVFRLLSATGAVTGVRTPPRHVRPEDDSAESRRQRWADDSAESRRTRSQVDSAESRRARAGGDSAESRRARAAGAGVEVGPERDGGVALPPVTRPFRDRRLAEQIDRVVESLDRTGKPPPGVRQGKRKGLPRGRFANEGTALPRSGDDAYYTETDVWPTAAGAKRRGVDRLVLGTGGEVYYSAGHYQRGTFVRIR